MRVFCAILVVGTVLGPSLKLQAQLANGIKAIVHDSVVTVQEVQASTAPLVDDLRRQYRNQPDAYEKKLAEVLNENLEILLDRQLILHDFKTAGYNLPESIIEEEVQKRIRRDFGDRAKLTKTLQAEGITYEKFHQQVREQVIYWAMQGKNVSSEFIVSPHKIETYYIEHTNQFKVEDEVKLRMIVLNKPSEADAEQTHRLADEIFSKIKAGATFAEMASVYSQGSQRSQGGDWGWVEKPVLRQELAAVAFSLKPGELSGVIDIPGACYLMLVEERRPEHIKPLSDVRDEIEKTLLGEQRARLQKQWIDRLKKKTFVRYF